MAADIGFSCRCGALQGILHGASAASGCHLVCYCKDCRAFAHRMGVADDLLPGGGSPLFQTTPAMIEITRGAERIACLRLSSKGLHRWYAACCDTPLANTAGSSRIPFAGLWRPILADHTALGPVRTLGFTQSALAGIGAPRKDKGLARMVGGLLRRGIAAYLSGEARKNPFFDSAGHPVATPTIAGPTPPPAPRQQ
ncbi:DUF6151 family protein [Oceaniglobus indicus]|uniref:DUF6151 family protein n=1 Tax=Oceaniglobus indicus TaxID=2047749 RepID=UPI000C1827EA|nr:DUF6151 family protein [Oceaniglobus indicus]